MIVDGRSTASLNVQEVNAPDLSKLADVFLRKNWKRDLSEDQPSFNVAMDKLLSHLNIEYNLDSEIIKNHHLLWFRNDEVIGFTKVTDIQPGKEAKIKFILLDDTEVASDEIEDSLVSSVEKVFSKFDLQRLLISVDTSLEKNPLELKLLDHYQSIPLGFVHLPTKIREYAILDKATKLKSYFTYWL